MKLIKHGLILLYLTVSLTGCAARDLEVLRIPVEKTVIEKVYVPAELARPCPGPNLEAIETTGDIEAVALDALAALKVCDEDKAAIREWGIE